MENKTDGETSKKESFFDNKWFILGFFLVVGLLIFATRYESYQDKIIHDFPISINAGDPNSRQSEAEWVAISKIYDLEPPWFHTKKNIAQHYAPILIIVPAVISQATGIPVYDAFLFLGVLVSFGLCVIYYILFKRIFNNTLAALLSSALLIYPYEIFYHYQLNIGMYGNYFTVLFYPLAILFLLRYLQENNKRDAFAFVVTVVLQYMIHSSEAIVLVGFCALFALIFHFKKIKWSDSILFGLMFLILILPHLPLFYYSWVGTSGHAVVNLFTPYPAPAHEPQFGLFNVLNPIYYLLLIVGLFVVAKNSKYRLLVFLALAFLFVTFILAYIGIASYYITIRSRYLLFVFLYPLVAIGLAALITSVLKRANPNYSQGFSNKSVNFWVVLVLIILISGFSYNLAQSRAGSGSLISKEIYDGFLFVKENSLEDQEVICFGCYQFEGLNTHRMIYQPNYFEQTTIQQLVDLSNGNSNNTNISLEYSGYRDTEPVKTGLFTYETVKPYTWFNKDFCEVDYFIIKPYGQLTTPFIGIGQRLVQKGSVVVFSNQQIIIIKNNFEGKQCI